MHLYRDDSPKLLLSQVWNPFLQAKRLFGHPEVVIVPDKVHGRDLFKHLAMLLPFSTEMSNPALASLPFTLHLVSFEVNWRGMASPVSDTAGSRDTFLAFLLCFFFLFYRSRSSWQSIMLSACFVSCDNFDWSHWYTYYILSIPWYLICGVFDQLTFAIISIAVQSNCPPC